MGAQAASDNAYHFTDAGSSVTVLLNVDGNASDFDTRSTGDSLRVIDNRNSQTLLNIVQLYSTIEASATQSKVAKGRLVLTLTKLDADVCWPALEAQSEVLADPSQVASEAQTSRALQEREKVKALLTAAQSGSVPDLQKAASHFSGQQLGDIKDGTGKNVLHFAAQLGQTDVCQYLLTEHQLDPNVQDEAGETALTLAAGSAEELTVSLLLKHGADVSRCRPGGAQPIHTAAASGDYQSSVAVVKLLLERGADASAACDAGSPVMWAAGSGKSATLEVLLQGGADPNTPGNANVTAALAASAAGNVEAVRALVKANADVSIAAEGGVTALHAAAELGNLALVQLLLQGGADANAEDAGGQKAIHAAAAEQHRDIVELLLQQTTPDDDNAADWTVEGVIQEAQQSIAEDQPDQQQHQMGIPDPEEPDEAAAADHKRKGDVAFVGKRYQEALNAYSQSLRHKTSNHIVWANRSAVYLRLEKPQDALQDARRARTLDESYTKAWFREGSAAKELELYEDAAQAFFEAYRLDSSNPELAQAFQESIKLGQDQHRKQQQLSKS
ncbi:TPA: hypothetical protein ACH3X2_006474 [Trebouxia sp. C0005]